METTTSANRRRNITIAICVVSLIVCLVCMGVAIGRGDRERCRDHLRRCRPHCPDTGPKLLGETDMRTYNFHTIVNGKTIWVVVREASIRDALATLRAGAYEGETIVGWT